jgi:hypothetical protein
MVWAPLKELTYPEAETRPGVLPLSDSPVAADIATSIFHAPLLMRYPPGLLLTPVQFALFCEENREAVLEFTADGSLIVMTPTVSETGVRNSRLDMPPASLD